MRVYAIRTHSLSKRYDLGDRPPYGTMRDSLSSLLRGVGRPRAPRETLWALREISLEVPRGEFLALIGRNGSGKSTLLKILSRITEPTGGWAECRGRVGSLLEVGAGFHTELTGRENVFLNASILGMKRSEILRKFDAIVAFAEVERFIDTPIKHYSSGLYMRLAFSVAAHLEPDILLVDEVLAVGDARFWAKSVDKMRRLNEAGMTIVLVTHNMWQVQTLCTRALCLDRGSIVAEGDPLRVIGAYKSTNAAPSSTESTRPSVASSASVVSFQLLHNEEWPNDRVAWSDSSLNAVLRVQGSGGRAIQMMLRVTGADGFPYFTVSSPQIVMQDGVPIEYEVRLPSLMLMPGEYLVWGVVCSYGTDEQVLDEKSVSLAVRSQEGLERKDSVFWNRATWHVRSAKTAE